MTCMFVLKWDYDSNICEELHTDVKGEYLNMTDITLCQS